MSVGSSRSEAITVSFLTDLVLILGDEGLVVVAGARQQVPGDVELLGGPDECVVRVGELSLDRVREEPVRAHVERPVHDAPHRRARRPDRTPGVEEIVA